LRHSVLSSALIRERAGLAGVRRSFICSVSARDR
jgi:hypothetical protein